jgi:hypothetical protein
MLPSMSTFSKLPATRPTKMSPIAWSKTISVGTRESRQLSTMALGNWPSRAVIAAWASQSCRVLRPATKRSLPALRSASTASGVRACWMAFVVTRLLASSLSSSKAARGRAATVAAQR